MSTMPKKIDEELKARAVRLVNDHLGEYSSVTAASAVVAKQVGVGKESVRRCSNSTGLIMPRVPWRRLSLCGPSIPGRRNVSDGS